MPLDSVGSEFIRTFVRLKPDHAIVRMNPTYASALLTMHSDRSPDRHLLRGIAPHRIAGTCVECLVEGVEVQHGAKPRSALLAW